MRAALVLLMLTACASSEPELPACTALVDAATQTCDLPAPLDCAADPSQEQRQCVHEANGEDDCALRRQALTMCSVRYGG